MTTLSLKRVYEWLEGFWSKHVSQGNITFSGILGLALLLVGFYQWRSGRGNRPRSSQPRAGAGTPQGQPAAAAGQVPAAGTGSQPQSSQQQAGAVSSTQHQQGKAADVSNNAAKQVAPAGIRARLAGINKLSISVPGVLLQEWGAHELSDSATFRTEAVSLLRSIISVADVYLIAHVMDDIGQAAVTGALEAEGLLGPGPGAVKPHRLLFCSTLEGKVSLVRQLEPDLHIDGHSTTLQELQRFMPQLLFIAPPGSSTCDFGSNVATYGSLQAWCT